MTGLISILLALNLVLGVTAGPIIAGGISLGSGANGSSFVQRTRLKTTENERKAALLIVNASCDESKWNEIKGDGPSYPKSDTELLKVIDNPSNVINLCQAQKEGKAGIVYTYGSGAEITNLLIDKWDRRVLFSIAYLLQRRFSTDGYGMVCEKGDLSAPIMTLTVTEPYTSAPATSKSRSSFAEDDPSAKVAKDNNVSPHAKGLAFDIHTFGCIQIYQDGDLKQINPVPVGDPEEGSALDPEAAAEALQKNGQDPDMASAGAQSQDNLYSAGAVELSKKAGELATMNQIADPQEGQSILSKFKGSDPLSAEKAAEKAPEPSINKAANITANFLEKKLSLPNDTLKNGVDLSQSGKADLKAKTGIEVKDDGKIPPQLKKILMSKGSSFALSIPQSAVVAADKGQDELALKIIGANNLNSKLKLQMSPSEIEAAAKTGKVDPAKIEAAIFKKVTIDDEEKKLITPLVRKGIDEVGNVLFKQKEEEKKDQSRSLTSKLDAAPTLQKADISDLKDLMSDDPVVKDGARTRLKNSQIAELKELAESHGDLSEQDRKLCLDVIKTYEANPDDPKKAIRDLKPTVEGRVLAGFMFVLNEEERLALQSAIGTDPTADEFEAALENGRLEQASKIFYISKTLQRGGLDQASSRQIAFEISTQGKVNDETALAAAFNKGLKKYNLTFTPSDFMKKDGDNYPPAVEKVAMNRLAAKTGIPQVTLEALRKDGPEKNPAVAKAVIDKLNLPSWAKKPAEKYIKKMEEKKDKPESQTQAQTQDNDPTDDPVATEPEDRYNMESTAPWESGEAAPYESAASEAGAGAKAKQMGSTMGSTPEEKKSIEDKVKKGLDDALDKGKEQGQKEVSDILQENKMGKEDADKIASGDFHGATSSALAATLAKNKKGDYATLKKAIDGDMTKDEKYSFGDTAIGEKLAEEGITYNTDGMTKKLFEDPDAREDIAKDLGYKFGAKELAEKAAEKGIPLNQQTAESILRDPSAKNIGSGLEDTGDNLAANKIAESTNGLVNADQVKSLIKDIRSDGIDPANMKDLGYGIVENKTGIPVDKLKNYDQFLDQIKQTYNPTTMLSSLATSVILGTIGGKLAEIDPTGGLATNFLMNEAAAYLSSLGLSMPVLLAIALIINPKAVFAAVKGMIKMAFNFLVDPIGAIMSILGSFGIGNKKPKMGPELKGKLKSKAVAVAATAADKAKDAVKKSEAEDPASGGAEVPLERQQSQDTQQAELEAQLEASMDQGADQTGEVTTQRFQAEQNEQEKAEAELNLDASGQSKPEDTQNTQKELGNSPYLAMKKPSEKLFKQNSVRTIDQVSEDIMTLAKISTSHSFATSEWDSFMNGIKVPSYDFAPKQIFVPRAVLSTADQSKLKIEAKLYGKDEGDNKALGPDYLLALAKDVFGKRSVDLDKINKRIKGVLYSSNIKAYLHVGY